MTVLHLPRLTAPDGHYDIALSLKHKATVTICYTGCHALVPGAIVSLETRPEHDWLVCWVIPPPRRYPTLDARAGIMPVPEGHKGPWPQEKGWEL